MNNATNSHALKQKGIGAQTQIECDVTVTQSAFIKSTISSIGCFGR